MEFSDVVNTDSGLHPEKRRDALGPPCIAACPVPDTTSLPLRARSPRPEGAVLG